jgi:hypothetical protein
MRRGGAFWGILLIAVGGLFMLNTLGLLTISIWKLIIPVSLVLLGLWVLLGKFSAPRTYTSESVAVNIPLEGAERARVRLLPGAGRLQVSGVAPVGQLVDGTFGVGADYDVRRDGATLEVDLRGARDMWLRMVAPWNWGETLDWDFSFNGDIPLDLSIESGAGDIRLNLSELRVTYLNLQTGMGATKVTLPAKAGQSRAKIRSGMGEIKVYVPEGVAARIHATRGMGEVLVNDGRFPRTGDAYQSPDYDTSEHKVEIDAKTGMGALKIM